MPLIILAVFRLGHSELYWYLIFFSYILCFIYVNYSLVKKYKTNKIANLLSFCFLVLFFSELRQNSDLIIGYGSSQAYSNSSFPTIEIGDMFLNDYWFVDEQLFAGQFVGFFNDGAKYQKRIHGSPYDNICQVKNKVFINGRRFYLSGKWRVEYFDDNNMICDKAFDLKRYEYFVLGDNLKNSYDSRYFGMINRRDIFLVSVLALRNNEIRDMNKYIVNFDELSEYGE